MRSNNDVLNNASARFTTALVCVGLAAGRVSNADDKPPVRINTPAGPVKLTPGPVRIEFSTSSSKKWLVSTKDRVPLGIAPGNAQITLADKGPTELTFSRENATQVTTSVTLTNGVVSFKNTYQCNDAFLFETRVVSSDHLVVTIKVSAASMTCSPAFATSKSRYNVTYQPAAKGEASEIYVVSDSGSNYFSRFASVENKATVSLVATVDHVVVMRHPSYFDCARNIQYVFKKGGGAIKIDGTEFGIYIDPPPGGPSTTVECEMIPIASPPATTPPATTPPSTTAKPPANK